jgi:hypothetical protein
VIENKQKRSSSTAWSSFGFPARLTEDGIYQRLHGYSSCFKCKATYTFQSGGSGSTSDWILSKILGTFGTFT